MKKNSGGSAASDRPSQESNGSDPLLSWIRAEPLITANQPMNALINMDLSKFNVVNSLVTCENTPMV